MHSVVKDTIQQEPVFEPRNTQNTRKSGCQDVRNRGCFSVCSVLSVVQETILKESILEPRNTLNTRKSVRHPSQLFFRVFRAFGGSRYHPERIYFRTTEYTEHTEVRTPETAAVFPCVPCFRWFKKPSCKNLFWNHGIHRTHGSQDVIPRGCFSVCSVFSVVKDTILKEPVFEPRNTLKSGREQP